MNYEPYDLIGDIHGQASVLRDLLARLGYEERAGCYRHPERRVIFLGDYVDRGPGIRETLQIVRAMVDHGAAQAICGNHELDALLYATPDGKGGWLRPHDGRQKAMQSKTEEEFAGWPDEWKEWLHWFQTLPLLLDLPGLRAVHACWNEGHAAGLKDLRLTDDILHKVAAKTGREAEAIQWSLKGPEVPLPAGVKMQVEGGNVMDELRVRWWVDGRGETYRNACIHRHSPAPDLPIAREHDALLTPNLGDDRPVFFGHYWLPAGRPALITPHLACLDYSVAGGGPLVAYRWDGEQILDPEKFVFDERRLPEETATLLPPSTAGSFVAA